MKWQTAWQVTKDVLLTGTGLLLIILQVFARHPSDVLLVTGLALTVPAAATHTAALLSGPAAGEHDPGSSSGSSPPHGSPPAPSPSPPRPGDPDG